MTGRASAPIFWIVIGLVAGVLVSLLALPERTEVRAGAFGTDGATTGSDTAYATDAGGDAAASAGTDAGTTSGGAVGTPRAGTDAGPNASGSVPAGGASAGTSNARGVDPQRIKVGVACVDLSVFRQLGQAYNEGDCRKQFDAVLDRARREKRLPVHGRDIEFVYRRHGILSQDEVRASCEGFMRDDKVFAVLANTYYELGVDCVAREFRTPVITANNISDGLLQRGGPYAFVMSPTQDRMLRNFAHWLDARGLAKGKKIGLYTTTARGTNDLVNRTFVAELKKLGYDLAATVVTNQDVAGPDDNVAVQRFRSANVDLAVLMVNAIAQTSFMQTAETQRYKPTYVESDLQNSSDDTAASSFPESQFDGSYAFTTFTVGETGTPQSGPETSCIDNYKRFSNSNGPKRGVAEWHYIEFACDLTDLLLTALEQAGPTPTADAMVGGLEAIRERPESYIPSVTFGPGKHAGGEQYRTIQWRASCRCYMAVSPFAPLFVP